MLVRIEYDEGDQSTYSAVILQEDSGNLWKFASGDPEKDWAKAMNYYANFEWNTELVYASSVDNFIMDGDKYGFDENEMLIRLS